MSSERIFSFSFFSPVRVAWAFIFYLAPVRGSDYASLDVMVSQPVTWRVHAVIISRNIDLGRPIRCLTAVSVLSVFHMSPANSSIHALRKIYDVDVNHMHINLEIKKLYILNRASILNLCCTIIFFMARSSKQDHTCLCLSIEFFF